MPDAVTMTKRLVGVDDNAWLKVRVYPKIVKLLAGREVDSSALIAAITEVVCDVLNGGTRGTDLLLAPFMASLDRHLAAITPASRVLDDARRAVAAGLEEVGL
jgi:hypothetical protein